MVWIIRLFFVTSVLHNLNLVFFQTLLLSTYVPCEGNSSYEFYLFQIIPYFSKKFLAGDINSLNLLVFFFYYFGEMSFQQSGFSAKCCAAKLKPEVHNMSRIMRKPAFCIYDFSIKNYVVDCKFCHDKEILKSTHSMCFMEN